MASAEITVDLAAFRAALAQMDGATKGALEAARATAADLVATRARRAVPTRTGAARASLTASRGMISAGGRRAPYFGWLDWGGDVGRHGSVRRPFLRQGRFIYKAWGDLDVELGDDLFAALAGLARDAGLDVTGG